MNDQEMKKAIREAVDHRLSGLNDNPFLAQRIISKMKGESPVMKRKVSVSMVFVFVLLFATVGAVAGNINHIFDFMTNTVAKNWVLDEAENMLHDDVEHTGLNNCTLLLDEWICDGEHLYVSIEIHDPALETEGHFVPEDPEEEYLGGLMHYVSLYGLKTPTISSGSIQNREWNFEWADEEENVIRYTSRYALDDVSTDPFTVILPVLCSAGEFEMHYDIHHTDFGTVRDYQLPTPLTTHEYKLEITRLRSTALHTYADAKLTFDSSVTDERREEIAYAYLDGLLAPFGRLDIVEGEGEEIALPRSLRWSEDKVTAWIEIEGNPRESYPEKVAYYPRWGMLDYDWEGEKPSLSEENALIIDWKPIP